MPRIAENWFDDRFASQRSGLVETVCQHMSTQQPGLEAVGTWLDTEYSEAKVRVILERRRQQSRLRDAGQPTLPDGRRIPGSSYRYPESPGDRLRADRLEQAFTTLHGQNQGGDLLRLLGRNLPRDERETNALRAVVVSACIVDPDADEWLAPVTPLASCPWQGDSSAVPPVKGRADVAQPWAHEALRLLQEACRVLDWEPAADSDEGRVRAACLTVNSPASQVEQKPKMTAGDAKEAGDDKPVLTIHVTDLTATFRGKQHRFDQSRQWEALKKLARHPGSTVRMTATQATRLRQMLEPELEDVAKAIYCQHQGRYAIRTSDLLVKVIEPPQPLEN